MSETKKPTKCTEYLRYSFSEAERTENAKTLARQTQLAAEAELKKKRLMADIKTEIEHAAEEIARLARYVTDGYDYRMIECEWRWHTPKVGTKRLVRLDTGEVVKDWAMTGEELQLHLFEEPEPEPEPVPEPPKLVVPAPRRKRRGPEPVQEPDENAAIHQAAHPIPTDPSVPEWRTAEEIRAGVPHHIAENDVPF